MVETIEAKGPLIKDPADIPPEEPTTEPILTEPNALGYQMDDLISEYFLTYGHNSFGMSGSELNMLAKAAPRLLLIEPTSTLNTNWLSYEPVTITSTDNMAYVLEKNTRGAAKDFGLLEKDYLNQIDDIGSLCPEIQVISSISGQKAIGLLYMVVLGMQPHLRDVPALVISKNSQKPFDSFDEKIKNHLNQCTPSLTDILQVAKQYGVHNVKEIITDLVRVQSLYKANWDF